MSKIPINDFAIDYNNNTLIAGMKDGIIKMYDFKNGKVGDEKQSLEAHTDQFFCLYCMKNTDSFVSGGADKSIIIWCLDKVNKWKVWIVQQTLKGHRQSVYCIIMNLKEDELISWSYDGYVNFWKKYNDSWNFSDSVYGNGRVYALNLNENEDKLIMCNSNNQIGIINNISSEKWKLTQTIQVNKCGECFSKQLANLSQKRSIWLSILPFDLKTEIKD